MSVGEILGISIGLPAFLLLLVACYEGYKMRQKVDKLSTTGSYASVKKVAKIKKGPMRAKTEYFIETTEPEKVDQIMLQHNELKGNMGTSLNSNKSIEASSQSPIQKKIEAKKTKPMEKIAQKAKTRKVSKKQKKASV